MGSSLDEISSREKGVNIKRHFTIDSNDFIRERVSSRDKISRVNTAYNRILLQKEEILFEAPQIEQKSAQQNQNKLLDNVIICEFLYLNFSNLAKSKLPRKTYR